MHAYYAQTSNVKILDGVCDVKYANLHATVGWQKISPPLAFLPVNDYNY
jgi:hypothetical protein